MIKRNREGLNVNNQQKNTLKNHLKLINAPHWVSREWKKSYLLGQIPQSEIESPPTTN